MAVRMLALAHLKLQQKQDQWKHSLAKMFKPQEQQNLSHKSKLITTLETQQDRVCAPNSFD